MRSALLLRGNLRLLAFKSVGALWPPNLSVVGRNLRDLRRVEPWSDCVARTGDSTKTVRKALDTALRWLIRSQDQVGTGGIGSYEFYGWTPGYPEVTGYIIPTMWDCWHALGREELAKRAVWMANWELGIQKEGGGWDSPVRLNGT